MFPIIDFLNGLFISSGISLPIGMLYRMFCFFYLVVGILYAGFEKNLYTLVTVFFYLYHFAYFISTSGGSTKFGGRDVKRYRSIH